MPATLRAARPDDVELLLDLIRQLAEYERLGHEVVARADDLRQALFPPAGTPAARAVLAFDGAEPVGFALYFYTFSTFVGRRGLYLEDLYVRSEYRSRGHGRALLLHLAQLAHAEGCGRMEWSVLDWNTPAIAFYEGLGAQRMKDWTTCRLDRAALDRLAGQAPAASTGPLASGGGVR